MACVYCFQVGSSDCFKIGRTRNAPTGRMKNVSVGSPQRLTLYKTVETEFASRLESYLHKVLEPYRAPNGEFFNVTTSQLDDAVRESIQFVSATEPLLEEAKKLQRKKPTADLLEPSAEILALHRELKAALRQSFLLERKIEALQGKLQVAIGENLGFKGVASWKWRESWILNQALLKREEPELYEQYRERSGSRVFCLE